jgi:heme A synthase
MKTAAMHRFAILLMPKMEGGIFYMHGHRMVARVDGMLMILIAVWMWAKEQRRWLKWLGWIAGAHEIPTYIEDKPEAPIRALAIVVPLCVLGQLALGAAAGHKAIGTIWHICGSSIATGVVFWFAVRILLHYPDQPALRKSALALLGITFVQVFLGIAAHMSRIATIDAPQPMPVMILFTVLHVATGALTMAASAIAAIQVYRNVRRPDHPFAPQGIAIA